MVLLHRAPACERHFSRRLGEWAATMDDHSIVKDKELAA